MTKHLMNLQETIDAAAAALAMINPDTWAGWIIYLLEALDNSVADFDLSNFDAVMDSIEEAIAIRKADGIW